MNSAGMVALVRDWMMTKGYGSGRKKGASVRFSASCEWSGCGMQHDVQPEYSVDSGVHPTTAIL